MEWMMNRSPAGQWVAAFGLGAISQRIWEWPNWVGSVILLTGVAIGLVHHFSSVK